MANPNKLSNIIFSSGTAAFMALAFAVLLLGATLAGCKQPELPTDNDMLKAFSDNSKEYKAVVQKILAEPNQKFEITRGSGVSYQGPSSPPVSQPTVTACQQIMRRTFCLAAKRDAGTIYFIYYQDGNNEFYRRKSIIYDEQNFENPIWKSLASEESNLRYVPINAVEIKIENAGTDKEKETDLPSHHWQLEYKYEKHDHK